MANDPNSNIIPQAEMEVKAIEALGLKEYFNNAAEVQVFMKKAANSIDSHEKFEQAIPVLIENQKALSDGIKTLVENRLIDETNAKANSLDEKTVDRLRRLRQEDADQFESEVKAIATEFGGITPIEQALAPNYAKSIMRSVSSKGASAEDELDRAIQKVHDLVMIHGAISNPRAWEVKADGSLTSVKDAKASYGESLQKLASTGDRDAVRALNAYEKLMSNAAAGLGDEWAPDSMSGGLLDEVYLRTDIASQFGRRNMPSAKWSTPIRIARPKMYRMSQATLDSQLFTNLAVVSNQGSDTVDFEAEKLAVAQTFTEELRDDNNLFDVLGEARAMIAYASGYGIDDACMNGSTLLTDLDNQGTDGNRLYNNTADGGDGIRLATGATDVRNAWDGIRKTTPAGAQYAMGAPATGDALFAALLATLKKMGKYAGASEKGSALRLFTSTAGYLSMFSMTQLQTLEKYGPNAVVVSGEVAKFLNTPVIQTPNVYENLNATGVFDNVTETKTLYVYCHQAAYLLGIRRQMQVTLLSQAFAGMDALLGTLRMDFQKAFAASETCSAIGYNMTS